MPAALSRRAFLKASATGLGAFVFPLRFNRFRLQAADYPAGRVTNFNVWVHAAPSTTAEKTRLLSFDTVVNLSGLTVGDEQPEHNRVWYLLDGDEGFVHSGTVQPVRTELNAPLAEIPEDGALAEVSVPMTDLRWGPGRAYGVAHRLYYQSVHWLVSVLVDDQGESWYKVWDDRKRRTYWGSAPDFRPIPPGELEPLAPEVPPGDKLVVVDLANQWISAYEGSRRAFMTRVSTGVRWSTGDFRTPPGAYVARKKRPSRHMAGGDRAAEDWYDLPGVPWVTYFFNGIALHGTYWHNDFGIPRSHGCVNLTPEAAKWMYRWTLPSVPYSSEVHLEASGTRIEVV